MVNEHSNNPEVHGSDLPGPGDKTDDSVAQAVDGSISETQPASIPEDQTVAPVDKPSSGSISDELEPNAVEPIPTVESSTVAAPDPSPDIAVDTVMAADADLAIDTEVIDTEVDAASDGISPEAGEMITDASAPASIPDSGSEAEAAPDAIAPNEPDTIAPNEPDAIAPNEPDAIAESEPDAIAESEPDAIAESEPDAIAESEPDATLAAANAEAAVPPPPEPRTSQPETTTDNGESATDNGESASVWAKIQPILKATTVITLTTAVQWFRSGNDAATAQKSRLSSDGTESAQDSSILGSIWQNVLPILLLVVAFLLKTVGKGAGWILSKVDGEAYTAVNDGSALSLPERIQSTPVGAKVWDVLETIWGLWAKLLGFLRDRVFPESIRHWSNQTITAIVAFTAVFILWLSGMISPSPAQEVASGGGVAPVGLDSSSQTDLPVAPPKVSTSLSKDETLATSIQEELTEQFSPRYSEGMIQAVAIDRLHDRLTVMLGQDWYDLSDSEQQRLAQKVWSKTQGKSFSHLTLVNLDGVRIARDPVVGADMLLFQTVPPVIEPPVIEAPVEALVDEAPVDEASVDEASVDEAPVDEAPVDEASVEAPVDEVSVDEALVDEPTVETPSAEVDLKLGESPEDEQGEAVEPSLVDNGEALANDREDEVGGEVGGEVGDEVGDEGNSAEVQLLTDPTPETVEVVSETVETEALPEAELSTEAEPVLE